MTVALGAFLLGASGQQITSRNVRLSLGASWRPSSAALGALSGVLYGPAGSMGEATLVNPTTLQVNPFVAVVQGTLSAVQGQYHVPNDTLRTLAITAQHASQFRRSLWMVTVDDSEAAGVASSATTDRARLHMLDGALSATAPAPLPTVPANSVVLGEVGIPPAGQTVTITPYNPRTTARGGILPVANDASTLPGHGGALPVHDGEARWHPVTRLEVGVGGAWEHPGPMGVVGFFSIGANSGALDTNTLTRLTGTINGTCFLRAGRIYRVQWHAGFTAATANQIAVASVLIYNEAATPVNTDITVAVTNFHNSAAAQQTFPVCAGHFRVATSKNYAFSPYLRRGAVAPNTGTVQATTFPYSGASIMYIQVEDLGSYAFAQAQSVNNFGLVPLVNI